MIRDVWAFLWTRPDVPTTVQPGGGTAAVEVEVLVADGATDPEGLASRVLVIDAATGEPFGLRLGNGFFSRAQHEEILARQTARKPAGPITRIGSFNGDPTSAAYLGAYLSNGVGWCIAGFNSDGLQGGHDWCANESDPRDEPIRTNLAASFKGDGTMTSAALSIETSADIVRVTLFPGDGRELSYETVAPPPQSGVTRRYAWAGPGTVSGDYTVVGYAAAGEEVFRTGQPAPTLPPELHR